MANLVFFHAHPDDESIATAGSMLKAARDGHRVVLLVATGGELGEVGEGVLAEGETLGERRAAEVAASAEVLEVARFEMLGYHDSGMAGDATNDAPHAFWQTDTEEAAERVAEILREERTDLLTIYDPNGSYGHPDHIKVHQVGTRAAELAGVEKVFWSTMNRDQIKRQMAVLEAAEALLDEERRERASEDNFGMPESEITHAVDVSDVLEEKKAAMKAHATQITEESFFLTMDDDQFAQAFGTEWYAAAHLPKGARQPGFKPGAPKGFFADLLNQPPC